MNLFRYLLSQMKGVSLQSGLILVGIFLIIAILAPIISPHSPIEVFEGKMSLSPFWSSTSDSNFLLGTDDLGRDILSRLIYGSRVSFFIGFMVVIISTTLGTIMGLMAAYYGGWVDSIVSRFIDFLMVLPSLLTAVCFVAVLGVSLSNTVFTISVLYLPQIVKVVRSCALIEKNKNYVVAAETYGAGSWRINFIHILPNILGPLLVQATFGFSEGILSASALGFLGLGVQAPLPEWGTMLSDARSYIDSKPILVTLPGLCILLLVMGFNLLGEGLKDRFDQSKKGGN